MPNLFPQLLAAVFSCIFHGFCSFPLLQLSIFGVSLPTQVPVRPGLLGVQQQCHTRASPVTSPSAGAAAPLTLGGANTFCAFHTALSELEKHPQIKDSQLLLVCCSLCAKGMCSSCPSERKSTASINTSFC